MAKPSDDDGLVIGRAYTDKLNPGGPPFIWGGTAGKLPAVRGQDGKWTVDRSGMQNAGVPNAVPVEPKAMDDQDAKTVAGYRADADQVTRLSHLSDQFMQHNRSTPTGGILALPGASRIAQAMPGTSDDLEPMNNIATQMATAMRATGMRLTQMEFGKFLGSTNSPTASYQQNAAMNADIHKAQLLAQTKSIFYDNWNRTHGGLQGADANWQTFTNQHFSPDLGTFYADPRERQNAMLKAQSAQGQQPGGAISPDQVRQAAQQNGWAQ